MFGDVYQLIIVAMICMVVGTVAAFYIYYQEIIAEQAIKEKKMKEESNVIITKLKSELDARDASAALAANLTTDNIPTDWMSSTLENITSGRLFRITAPIYTYADASNNGDAVCRAFDASANMANYSHLKYAYAKNKDGTRKDASANWCEYSWGRGGKTSADGLAFKMADDAYTSKNASACGSDSSGIHVLNAYKWNPETKMGIICYTPKTTVASTSNASPLVYNGKNLTATYENFETNQSTGFVNNVKKALIDMMSPVLPAYSSTRESFISYDSQMVPVFSDTLLKSTMDGKYALF